MCESQDADVEERRLPEVTSCCPWAARLAGQMARLSRELLALQEQLQQLVAQRKAAWWDKVRAGVLLITTAGGFILHFSALCPWPVWGRALCPPCCSSLGFCAHSLPSALPNTKHLAQRGHTKPGLSFKAQALQRGGKRKKRGGVMAAPRGDGCSRLKAVVMVTGRK